MSKKYSLNKKDLTKILKGLGITTAGAVLTYITDTIPNVDLGEWSPVVMAAWSVVVNILRKYITK